MVDLKAWFRKKERSGPLRAEVEARFRQKYGAFRRLLTQNHEALAVLSDLEEKYSGEYLFDIEYLRSSVRRLSEKVYHLIQLLQEIAGKKYPELYARYEEIHQQLLELLSKKKEIPVDELVLPLSRITWEKESSVGAKMAHLGELRNRLGLPVPEGFAITAYAYRMFIAEHHLQEEITRRLKDLNINRLEDLKTVSEQIQQMILEKPLPPILEETLENHTRQLTESLGPERKVALRSSALGEDTRLTFAGQYGTILNIDPRQMGGKYKAILASKFTPRAIFYFMGKGFREEELAMGTGCLIMIPAKAGGVMYTVDPGNPQRPEVIIHAHWGLGKTVVDGSVSPDVFRISKEAPYRLLEAQVAFKERMLVASSTGGIEWREVPPEQRSQPSLTEETLSWMGYTAKLVEEHFGHPQDIEWALDETDQVVFLQTRPLKIFSRKEAPQILTEEELSRYPVLLETGVMGAQGVGYGPAFLVRQEKDLIDFPPGAVCVARTPSPKLVTILPKAKAVITDLGSAASHLAALAREFRVPTLLNTQQATRILTPGREVTVDATHCRVYQGRVEKLIDFFAEEPANPFEDTPLFILFDKILTRIIPLHLVDPGEDNFTPSHCRTYHDLIRFVHQTAAQEMFSLSQTDLFKPTEVPRLETDAPMEILLIDLGGVMPPVPRGRKVKLEMIRSWPMQAFWKGVQTMKWPGPKPMEVKGFTSVLYPPADASSAEDRVYSEKSFALLSSDYMNFNIRLGYHLSTIEALGGPEPAENYIHFFFKGGGATLDRRDRRARVVATILERFLVQQKRDLVEARLFHPPRPEMENILTALGKLMVYTKQLDMIMFNEAIVEWSIEEFFKQHFGSGEIESLGDRADFSTEKSDRRNPGRTPDFPDHP